MFRSCPLLRLPLLTHVKTACAKLYIFGTKNIGVWGNVLDDLSMTLTLGYGYDIDQQKFACLPDKVRTTHAMTLQILACFLSSRLSKSQSVSSLEKFSEWNTAPGPLSGLHGSNCSFWSLGCLLLNVVTHSIIKWSEKMDSALVWLCRNCGLFPTCFLFDV